MPARRQLAIRAQIDTQPEAARAGPASLICLHDRPRRQIPHMYPPVVRCAREVLLPAVERDRPHVCHALALRLRRGDVEVQGPVARGGVAPPDLDVAAKADGGGDGAVAAACRGRDVVRAELVCVEGLGDGEAAGSVGGVVDIDGRGAAAREEGVGGRGERENVGRVGLGASISETRPWAQR